MSIKEKNIYKDVNNYFIPHSVFFFCQTHPDYLNSLSLLQRLVFPHFCPALCKKQAAAYLQKVLIKKKNKVEAPYGGRSGGGSFTLFWNFTLMLLSVFLWRGGHLEVTA